MAKKINLDKQFAKPPKAKGYKTSVSYSLNTDTGEYKQHVSYTPKQKQVHVSGSGILGVIVLILLVVMVFGVLIHGDDYNGMLSFKGLLEVFQNAPNIPTDWIAFGNSIPQHVKDIPVIGSLVVALSTIIEVVLFICVGISQTIVYAGYFLKILFA